MWQEIFFIKRGNYNRYFAHKVLRFFSISGIDLFLFVLGEIGFEPFGEFAAGEHDAPSAAFAFQPNIRA